MKYISLITLTLLASISVSGCSTTSEGRGVIQDKSGHAKGSVTFTIKEDALSIGDANVTAQLSNGEVYKGKFIIAKTQGSVMQETYNPKTKKMEYGINDSVNYSSKASGLLFGTTGKSMKCEITLSDPSDGFGAGGFGHCKLSTGQTIPLQFEELD